MRTAMFRLTDEAKDGLSEALLEFGAQHGRTGLTNKEEALSLLVRTAMDLKHRIDLRKSCTPRQR